MLKSELKTVLREADARIDRIREEQLEIVAAFIHEKFGIEKGDKLVIKGYTVAVVGFELEGLGYLIKVCYKRIKSNGNLDNVVFKSALEYKFKNLGKYNGKL